MHLNEVADVTEGAAEPNSAALFNGSPAIGLDIIKSREASTTGTVPPLSSTADGVASPPQGR